MTKVWAQGATPIPKTSSGAWHENRNWNEEHNKDIQSFKGHHKQKNIFKKKNIKHKENRRKTTCFRGSWGISLRNSSRISSTWWAYAIQSSASGPSDRFHTIEPRSRDMSWLILTLYIYICSVWVVNSRDMLWQINTKHLTRLTNHLMARLRTDFAPQVASQGEQEHGHDPSSPPTQAAHHPDASLAPSNSHGVFDL